MAKECNIVNMLVFIEALESGQYKQGTSDLRKVHDNGESCYCAEGVACEVSEIGDWHADHPGYYVVPGEGMEVGYVDGPVRRWLGVEKEGMWGIYVDGEPLFTYNDGKRMTFPEIAQMLREEYLS